MVKSLYDHIEDSVNNVLVEMAMSNGDMIDRLQSKMRPIVEHFTYIIQSVAYDSNVFWMKEIANQIIEIPYLKSTKKKPDEYYIFIHTYEDYKELIPEKVDEFIKKGKSKGLCFKDEIQYDIINKCVRDFCIYLSKSLPRSKEALDVNKTVSRIETILKSNLRGD